MIHEKDADAWTYANELGKVRLSLGSDADYSTEDGSNEAGQEFLAWLEDYRTQQEEALKAQQAATTKKPSTREACRYSRPKTEEEGFSMIKMVEGHMMEYRIVPGKLPVLIGEVGGESPVTVEPKSTIARFRWQERR